MVKQCEVLRDDFDHCLLYVQPDRLEIANSYFRHVEKIAEGLIHDIERRSTMNYYLMDLERSVSTGEVHYWKEDKRGYTKEIDEAGLYTEELALQLYRH